MSKVLLRIIYLLYEGNVVFFYFYRVMGKKHLLSIPLSRWENEIVPLGQSKFRVRQLKNWIFSNAQYSFEAMSNLPQPFRSGLMSEFIITSLSRGADQTASDGTVKFEFRTSDNFSIESVFLPDKAHHSLCISSQVGCAMGCRFCSTGTMGLKRNCTTGEILDQFALINQYALQNVGRKITNVIFMGMGEPLHNFEAVQAACQTLCSDEGFRLSSRRITVSTCGLIPQMKRWVDEMPHIKLAVSLNGATDTIRGALMPVNKKYSLSKLSEAIAYCSQKSKWPVTLEYVLIRDHTCTPAAAEALRKFASQLRCKVNLIVYNGSVNGPFSSPTPEEAEIFKQTLDNCSFPVMMRKSRGSEISAACGQLVNQQKKAA